ncbi:MAG TPA: NADH dehydrogenase [candidate division WOR-3 bacterium]|uniref:NADH dehydrogenase n=1 Tax=candidate division WOR-3 bacterium TaxID=2052148 RepID=A0A7V0XE74_UNCW3|nr:NADH dehydrogenase [candidate division WOR-3 bacterium]
MNLFILVILVPALAGLVGWVISRLRNELSFIGAILTLYFATRLFINALGGELSYRLFEVSGQWVWFRLDQLSSFILLFVAIFGVLVMLFSFRYMRNWTRNRSYYLYVMLLLAGANGVLLAGNLLTLLFFWGGLLVVTYGTLLVGRPGAEEAAGKALVVVGLSDFAMLLGIVMLLVATGGTDLVPAGPLSLSGGAMVASYLLIAAGALAKAGSMPFHGWIPQAAKTSPATVMALIPASIDKLLGIYLLMRVSFSLFDIPGNMAIRNVLMTVGAVTVVGAVMMALVQKRMMRLLSFHAVSQVGYMVLGIGTGMPIGVAGALFHMLNNVLYKTGLFLSAGTVEFWTHDDRLDRLGGLARQMPLTFFSFLICAMSIAGIPPLNGFFSKWMIYQGIIEVGGQGNRLYPLFLVAAMFGSVLTLASFLKLLHAVFLGQRPRELIRVREGSFTMWLPTVLIALTCIAFGVFAFGLPLSRFILPALPGRMAAILGQPGSWLGVWRPELATVLMIIALGVGALLYLLGTARKPVRGRTFVGGERIADEEESRVPGTAFYSSVKELPLIGEGLRFGEGGALDLHNWLKGLLGGLGEALRSAFDQTLDRAFALVGRFVLAVGAGASKLMTGQLPLYVSWMFLGAALLYLVLLLR